MAEPKTRPGLEKASGWFLEREQMFPISLVWFVFGVRWIGERTGRIDWV